MNFKEELKIQDDANEILTRQVKELKAEIQALRASSDGWLDISSAPMDGTQILIYEPRDELTLDLLSRKLMTEQEAVSRETYVVCLWEDGAWIESGGELYYKYKPTHWKPINPPHKPDGE